MRRVAALLVALITLSAVAGTPTPIAQSAALRAQGQVQQATTLVRAALSAARDPAERAALNGELGAGLLQARQFEAAETARTSAYTYFSGAERARYALELGNLQARRAHGSAAVRYYQEVIALGEVNAPALAMMGRLNMAALTPESERRGQLQELARQLRPQDEARLHLNLGHQAAQLHPPELALAYGEIELARQHAGTNGALALEADDALAALYEGQGRADEALALTRAALASSRQLHRGAVTETLIALEWRQGRLSSGDAALAAYQRAVEHIRASRADLPIEYDDGRSSYSATIAPVHLGYANLLLQGAGETQSTLRRVIDTAEQIKQAELQDYLGDRCVVEAVQGGQRLPLPAGVAVLYTLIFPDRIELLLETSNGIVRRTTAQGRAALTSVSAQLAASLRNGLSDFLPASQQLYDWLLRPFDDVLASAKVNTLIVVPDGTLRLLPFAALHDGQQYALEKYAVSTVTGMTMTNAAPSGARAGEALVVGLAEPGPVVDKLSDKMVLALGQASSTRGLASTRTVRSVRGNRETMRENLQLPGVQQEVQALAQVLPGQQLLNAQFTLDQFSKATQSSDYRIIHIASHGVFGGNADSSFILAYDDLLTMNALQQLLKADQSHRAPLELLSLSACETAEGNERAPLGMAGAAIKARAKSVLGTLWPLEDHAAQQIMAQFYTGLSKDGLGKAEALRRAQLGVLRDPNMAHPFFWGSVILIGNWQ